MSIPISVQLYTLRQETKMDFVGTLEKVAQTGYAGVEFAGYGNLGAQELRMHLDRLGLKASGSHVGLDLLKNNLDEIIQYNLEIGSDYVVCAWSEFTDKKYIIELSQLLNEAGKSCKDAGLILCYHNHAHEFIEIDGMLGLDILYSKTNPQYVQAEIDTYWVKRAEIDPVEYMMKYKGRCPLIHLKDMEDSEDKFFAEIGCGTMNIKDIADTARTIGSKWLVVEQDECKRSALESIKISFDNLKKMGIA